MGFRLFSSWRERSLLVLLLAFCTVIFLGTAFVPSILDNAGLDNAVAAREILQRQDWITLHVNSVRYLSALTIRICRPFSSPIRISATCDRATIASFYLQKIAKKMPCFSGWDYPLFW
jgi:hypothetical protein